MKNRVLVIEDDPSQQELMLFFLEAEGFEVKVTGGVDNLLTYIKLFEPNVIVTDIALPDVDGFSLIKTIHELFPKLPILAYSAHAKIKFKEFHDNAIKLGASEFISKPYDITEFSRIIRRLAE